MRCVLSVREVSLPNLQSCFVHVFWDSPKYFVDSELLASVFLVYNLWSSGGNFVPDSALKLRWHTMYVLHGRIRVLPYGFVFYVWVNCSATRLYPYVWRTREYYSQSSVLYINMYRWWILIKTSPPILNSFRYRCDWRRRRWRGSSVRQRVGAL